MSSSISSSYSTSYSSWVYLFSKFTPEALFLEALAIAIIVGVYAVTWFVNRRRIQADTQIPAGVVKDYLNMLITDAEYMRGQLFGLIEHGKVAPSHGVLATLGQAGAVQQITSTVLSADSPEMAARLAMLEAKMVEQVQATAKIESERKRLEDELAAARAGGGGDAGSSEMKQKVDLLESKLAEYAVIEDDLANLKRLQQENAQLKAQLGGAPTSVATPAKVAAPVAAAVVAAVALPEEAAPDLSALTETTSTSSEAALEATVPTTDAAAADPTKEFDALVDQVEASILGTPAGASAAPALEGQAAVDDLLASAGLDSPDAAPPSTDATPPASMGNDADLVAEFEKMLNG